MSKLSNFKKGLIYALATLLVIPTWLAVGAGSAEKVKAADFSNKYYKSDDQSYSEKTPDLWKDYAGGSNGPTRYTTSTDSSEYAMWSFSPDVNGEYQISVSWIIWHTQTEDAIYIVRDKNGENLPVHIDMTKDNLGQLQPNRSLSGLKQIGTYEFEAGGDYYVKLLASPTGHVHGDTVKIEHNNESPSKVELNAPANTIYTNSKTVNFDWQDSYDVDDDISAIKYELYVGKTDDFLTPEIKKIGLDVLSDSEYQTTMSDDSRYYWYVKAWDGLAYSLDSDVYEFTIDTLAPNAPMNLSSNLNQGEVTLNWDIASDNLGGSGIAGYNVYRYASPAVKLNTSGLVTSTNYVDRPTAVGAYHYYVKAVDKVGLESDKSVEVSETITYSAPASPNVTTVVNDKEIIISWKGVGNGIINYVVYVGGVAQTPVLVSGDDTGVGYSTKVTLTDYGNYEVYVKATGMGGITDSDKVVVSVSAPAATSNVSYAIVTARTVAPESASAADDNVADDDEEDVEEDGVEALDEDGKIKGEEDEKAAEEESDINWTPWIILFILIILAGAATGGYFYWFADEEEVETKVRESKKPAKSSAPKKSNKSKGSSKRRW